MKKFKTIIVVAVIIGILFTQTGCNNKGGVAKTDGKLTITWMGIPYFATAEKDTYSQKIMEEKFNIKIDPIFLDNEGYKNKKPIMMSSGTIPDIIYEMDPIDLQADVRQKFLSEVTYDDMKKEIPDYVKMVTETAPQVWMYSYCDEKNYGVPNLYYAGKTTGYGLWRQDWLENVGINNVPETIAEMEDAFTKFVENDPDKNGKKDTYALSGDVQAVFWCFTEIFGAYGVLPFNWMHKDGKIVYGGTQPQMKEALTTLSRWYSKGLISPDFITDATLTGVSDKFKAGNIGYSNVGGQTYASFDETEPTSYISILKSTFPDAKLAVAKHPVGPRGEKGSFAWGQGGHIIAMGRQVGNDAAKKTKIFEIINELMNNEELITQVSMGEQGTHYDLKDNSDICLNWISPYEDAQARVKTLAATGLGNSFFGIVPPKPQITEKYLDKKSVEFEKENFKPDVNLYDVFLKPDVVPASDKYFADLKNKQLVYIAKIIRGEESVDSYDKFISEWNTLGGKELETNAENTEKIYNEILAKVK